MDFVEIDFNWHEIKCDMILSFIVGCKRVQLILFYEHFFSQKCHFHWFRSIKKPFCIHVGKLFVSIFWKTKNKQKPQTFRLRKIQPKINNIQMSRRHSSTRGEKKAFRFVLSASETLCLILLFVEQILNFNMQTHAHLVKNIVFSFDPMNCWCHWHFWYFVLILIHVSILSCRRYGIHIQ